MWCLLLNGLIGILLLVASLVATYWILHLVGSLAEKFHLSAFGQGPYSHEDRFFDGVVWLAILGGAALAAYGGATALRIGC